MVGFGRSASWLRYLGPPKGLRLPNLKPPRGLVAASLMVSFVQNIEGSEGKGKRKEKKEREARAEEKRIVEEREREERIWGGADPYLYQACRLTSTSLCEGLEPSPRNQSSLDINSTRYTFWILKNHPNLKRQTTLAFFPLF